MEPVVLGSAEGETSRTAQLGLIAGGVISAYRASLVERDLWEHVRLSAASRGRFDAEWLDRISAADWIDAQVFVVLLEAIADTMGLDELRWLVRRRITDPGGSNFYAPILRSWARSFGKSPELMLRGVVHVFRAALRHAGQVRHVPVRAGEVHLLIEGPLERAYHDSPALATELEGLALSLLDYAHPRPVFVEVELRRDRRPVALVCSFHN